MGNFIIGDDDNGNDEAQLKKPTAQSAKKPARLSGRREIRRQAQANKSSVASGDEAAGLRWRDVELSSA